MKAIALICSKSMVFSLESVQLPEPAPGEVVVRTAFSGISIGTELALIQNKISWGPYPLCTGYMATWLRASWRRLGLMSPGWRLATRSSCGETGGLRWRTERR